MDEFDNEAPVYRGPPQQPEYQQQQEPVPQSHPEEKTNVLAILSLIFAFLFPPLGLIFGIIALVQISKDPFQKGKGLAIAGIIISILGGLVLFFLI